MPAVADGEMTDDTVKSSKRTGLLVAGIVIASLLLALVWNREAVERGYIAYRAYQEHVFTGPRVVPGQSRKSVLHEQLEFYWDFAGYVMERAKRLQRFEPELKPLVKQIDDNQAAGQNMEYSMHIYREIRWRLNFTNDPATTQARIDDLRASLTQAEMQSKAAEQQPSDGSYSFGINDAWYLTLYYSVEDGLDNLPANSTPQYRLAFLDRINSPEKLTAQLDSALYDKLFETGEYKREELDETFSALARLLFKVKPTGYAFDPGLQAALVEFVTKWQNPVTGCWGQWIVDRQGRVWKMDDMGMTFHVVSDLNGNVPHLDLVAKRLLELDRTNFPAGILFQGHYENHLNWDAVKIFRAAWPYLDQATRQRARAEISTMLNWSLTKSLQPDGSFALSDLDDTVGDAYDYGVYFLRDTGYFDPNLRFWTNQDFSDATAVRGRIEAKIKSVGLRDPGLRDAYNMLARTDSAH
jgi:hypothetical protein